MISHIGLANRVCSSWQVTDTDRTIVTLYMHMYTEGSQLFMTSARVLYSGFHLTCFVQKFWLALIFVCVSDTDNEMFTNI